MHHPLRPEIDLVGSEMNMYCSSDLRITKNALKWTVSSLGKDDFFPRPSMTVFPDTFQNLTSDITNHANYEAT